MHKHTNECNRRTVTHCAFVREYVSFVCYTYIYIYVMHGAHESSVCCRPSPRCILCTMAFLYVPIRPSRRRSGWWATRSTNRPTVRVHRNRSAQPRRLGYSIHTLCCSANFMKYSLSAEWIRKAQIMRSAYQMRFALFLPDDNFHIFCAELVWFCFSKLKCLHFFLCVCVAVVEGTAQPVDVAHAWRLIAIVRATRRRAGMIHGKNSLFDYITAWCDAVSQPKLSVRRCHHSLFDDVQKKSNKNCSPVSLITLPQMNIYFLFHIFSYNWCNWGGAEAHIEDTQTLRFMLHACYGAMFC